MARQNLISTKRSRRSPEAGQSAVFVILLLGTFLLGALCLAFDLSHMWFHRQAAQSAADAACAAGAMDLLLDAEGSATGRQGFTPGTPYRCSTLSTDSVCSYAIRNGYNSNQQFPGNQVDVSFPATVVGVPKPGGVTNPFIRVSVTDHVQTFFVGLLNGRRTADVAASSTCGVEELNEPVPILILNPHCQHAFQLSGSSNVHIVGGPNRSIQVNSDNSTCAAAGTNSGGGCTGNPTVDLSLGGPSFSGSEFSVFGAPATPSVTFLPGQTGDWAQGAPIEDPYKSVPAPQLPALSLTNNAPLPVIHNQDNCPDNKGCLEYLPGLYTKPIWVKSNTAIFVPGIYYMKVTTPQTATSGSPGTGCIANVNGQGRYALDFDSNSVVRPASNNAPGSDLNNGVMFYLSGTGAGNYASVYIDSNSGKAPGGHTVDQYQTANATCPGGSAPPPQLNLPSAVDGNVLVSPCTKNGTYIGTGSTDSSGVIRGLLVFQDRANADPNGQPSMQGGGGLILSGNLYFHNCNASGTGTNCSDPPAGYNAFYSLQGNPGSTSYVLGNITADQLVLGGGGTIAMSINPNAVYSILKAAILQ